MTVEAYMNCRDFKIGDVVRLSPAGRKNSKLANRIGRIVGVTKTRTRYRVLWSGLKSAQSIHVDFLEPRKGPQT